MPDNTPSSGQRNPDVAEKRGAFACIPTALLDNPAFWEHQATVRVYLGIASFADRDGHAFPTQEAIAKRIGASVKTVERGVHYLVRLSDGAGKPLIIVERLRRASGAYSRNTYRLNRVPAPGELTPNPSELRDGERATTPRQVRDGQGSTSEGSLVDREQTTKSNRPCCGDAADGQLALVASAAPPPPVAAPARPLNPLWDALVDVFGYSPHNGEAKLWGKLIRELREGEMTPDDVRLGGQRWEEDMPGATKTPTGLVKHLPRLVAGCWKAPQARSRVGGYSARQMADMAQASMERDRRRSHV